MFIDSGRRAAVLDAMAALFAEWLACGDYFGWAEGKEMTLSLK